jgi:hypothetical protein
VDIEKERAVTDALKINLKFASEQIDVSIFFLFLVSFLFANPDSSLFPATHKALLVEGSIYKSRSQGADVTEPPWRWVH